MPCSGIGLLHCLGGWLGGRLGLIRLGLHGDSNAGGDEQ
jgi:hypothetical protein